MAEQDLRQERVVTCQCVSRSCRLLEKGELFREASSSYPSRPAETPLRARGRKWGGRGRKSWKWLPIALMLFCRLTTGRQCETPSKENWQPGNLGQREKVAVFPCCSCCCSTVASWDTRLQQNNLVTGTEVNGQLGSTLYQSISQKMRKRINILLAAYLSPPTSPVHSMCPSLKHHYLVSANTSVILQ